MMNYFSKKFIKAQLASFSASIVDFSITYILTSIGGKWYVISSFLGVISGGIVNFSLGRNWVFDVTEEARKKQAIRYIIIWLSSMCLNLGGTVLLTEKAGLDYMASKVFTSVLVGAFFNFYFQKNFVFKIKA